MLTYRLRKLRKRFGVRRVLAAMAILFTGAAIYTSLLFEQRQDALSRASRYDLSWTAAQTANELSRLGQAVAIYAQRNGLATMRDVELRYELFLSRISLFDSPTFRAFALEDPRNAQIITEMRASGDALGNLIDHLDEPGNLDRATRMLLDLAPKAAVLASAANHSGASKVYEDYRGLLRLHYIYSAVTFTLVASGLILLWSLSRQNDLLNQTRVIAERAQAQAESGSQAKTEFLAAMSHEIRTPLHGILGFTDLILDRSDLTPDLRRYAERIRTSGSALLTVVNDVLDFSKIEAGAVDLNPRPFPLKAMIANCDSIMRKLAEANGLMLTVRVADALPGVVVGDEARIRQVLLNLLNNAIKFTPAGSVDLSVDEERAQGSQALRFTVRDTGVGIPFDKQDRLFQRFSQVDSSATRQYGGTGLGLAISKRLVELMGGTIGFESTEGRGSSFWFRVPLAAATESESETLEIRTRKPAEGRARVLVAEDVEINQEIAKAVLEGSGYEVDIVADGAEAVRAANARAYDLILMDIQMPGLDGIEATRRIRDGDGPSQGVPIIALTANVYREQIAKFLAMGMNDHLGKPFKRDELLHKVDAWLSRQRAPDGHGVEPPPPPAPEPEAAPEAYHDLLETVGPEVAARLLSRLSQILAAFPARIGTDEERAAAARAAHSIVSAAGQLGFEDLSDACRHLENAYRGGGDMAAALQRVDQLRLNTMRRIAGLRSAA